MRIASLSLGLAAVVGLASCATLSEEECQTVDFESLGFEDGGAGYRASRVEDHKKACAEHGLTVDARAYLLGWQSGITRYCTAQNGYDKGIDGQRYRGSCPAELAGPFLDAYTPAKRVHDAEDAVEAQQVLVDEKEAEVLELVSLGDEASMARAAELRRELIGDRSDLRDAQREARRARDALLLYLARHPEVRS